MIQKMRSRLRFWWKTRHWDRKHYPGCPRKYSRTGNCISPEYLCKWSKENT